jgi:hypothetical protein
LALAVLVALGTAARFWWPALRATGGEWPAPLDDVYIHYGFARSFALGHPFEWIAGQGYSSGETAPLWALLLAPGWLVGFRGSWLGAWAGALAVACVVWAMRSAARLAGPGLPSIAVALPLVAVGGLAWSLFSGMEVALFVGLAARMLVSAERARRAGPTARARAQWAVGAWGALLVWTRPESVVLIAPIAVVVARAARSSSPWAALLRVGAPGALATLAVLGVNRAMTGDWASAGARLKLLSSNPWLTDVDRARELVLNVLHFRWRVLGAQLAPQGLPSWLPFALAGAGLLSRRTRDLAAGTLLGAALFALLVSWNGAARYQNFRYYMPALALVLLAGALGARALGRSRAGRATATTLAVGGAALAALCSGPQVDFFRDASANVHEQQVEVGHRLARMGARRVLVGDAGAIPYVSGVSAVDALGLGGFRRMPWTRAAVDGQAATVELLQRLPPEERPSHMAVYPNWLGDIATHFGKELDRVTLARNVICGGPTKVIYLADWSALDGDVAPDAAIDELDVADVESERAHRYVSPAPRGGWPRIEVRATEGSARAVFDGGRTTPEGEDESFVLAVGAADATLVLRTVDEPAGVDVRIERGGERVGAARLEPVRGGARFGRCEGRLGAVRAGDRVVLTPRGGALVDFHAWLVPTRAP